MHRQNNYCKNRKSPKAQQKKCTSNDVWWFLRKENSMKINLKIIWPINSHWTKLLSLHKIFKILLKWVKQCNKFLISKNKSWETLIWINSTILETKWPTWNMNLITWTKCSTEITISTLMKMILMMNWVSWRNN